MTIQPHSQDKIDQLEERQPIDTCDYCGLEKTVRVCQCEKTNICADCEIQTDECVICEEQTCYLCDVLTEDGHVHKSCRDMQEKEND